MHWEQVLPDVWRFRDSCNVYALRGPEGMLIVDAGTGAWLRHLEELPAPPSALALTHYFRDHAAGAAAAARAGIPVYVPEYEREILADPAEHFRRRETYIIYDNLWDLFVPIEPTPIAGVLRDYDTLRLAGLDVEVVPLPGVTLSQSGLAVQLNEQKIICCGEAIHSPGRVARVAPFQYNYNDMPGAVNCYASAQRLREHRPNVLLPSLGEPMLHHIFEALVQLQDSMRALCEGRFDMGPLFDIIHEDSIVQVTEHVWQSTHSGSINWFVISDSGKCLALDYGYTFRVTPMPGYPFPARRRALLHSLDGLTKHTGIECIDVVLVSHFHDDHVCGIPVLQRVFGTECWAADSFADLLEQPAAHCFPCDWPVPARIDRRIALDEVVEWEGIRFHFGAMSGHTRFAALIGFEADGKRFAHTGDQYFFKGPDGDWSKLPQPGGWQGYTVQQNHVYRNGALLDGYAQSAQWMLDWRPDIVLTGHVPPMYTDETFFEIVDSWGSEYADIHRQSMPLGDDEPHFNLDSWGGWIWPYRTHLQAPGPATVRVTVRNPYPYPARLEISLVGPQGWQGSATTLDAPSRGDVSTELHITPDSPCRRQPFAVELMADGRPFGQVAEALITVGGAEF